MSADGDSGSTTTISAAGHDEAWLHDRLAEEPSLLGLGDVHVIGQEVAWLDGGSLDILAEDDDTYYTIEVQLGVVDPSHSFRVFDYWARNRAVRTDKAHVAVLVVESASGRYRRALQALAEYLPLIVIELRARIEHARLTLSPHVVIANDGLDLAVVPAADELVDKSAEDWRREVDPEAWDTFEALLDYARSLGIVRPEYQQRTYITLRRGRRSWAAVRFATAAIWVYLVDPDGTLGTGGPSHAFELFAPECAAAGVPITWLRGLNAGKQPIAVRLRRDDVDESVIQGLIKASWDWLDPNGSEFTDTTDTQSQTRFYPTEPEWAEYFDPYFELDSREVAYPGRGVIALMFHASPDDSRQLAVFDDEECTAQAVAERTLMHHTQARPTKKLIRRFVRDAMPDFDPGNGWSIRLDEVAAVVHEWG